MAFRIPIVDGPLKNKRLFDEYGHAENLCELAFELGLEWKDDGRIVHWKPAFLQIERWDVHHIWSVGRRPDLLSNLIAVAGTPHRLFHNGHKGEVVPLRLLCMLAKARKAVRISQPNQFNVHELNRAAGRESGGVIGWVECATIEPAWEWVEEFRHELIERIREAETWLVKD